MKKIRIVLMILFLSFILIGCENHTHDYVEEIVEATCVDKGYTLHKCIICGDSYKDNEVEAVGHIEEIIPETKPTCTTIGTTEGKKCKICGEILVPQQYFSLIDHTESNWIIDTESTCLSSGSKHIECSICKKVLKTEKIEIKDHNYVNGICSMCGKQQSSIDEIIIEDGYIYFGYYPQTLKEKNVNIISSTPDSEGYYRGDDGERYAKVEIETYNGGYIFNDKMTFIEQGQIYFFKVEPIKWKVESESNGTYKLISTVILDCQMFNSSWEKKTKDGQTIYANNYEYSDIRKWLNDDFLNKAFTQELQTYINTTEVDNNISSTGYENNTYICNNTLDKIYLPSYSEMTNTSYGYTSSSSRQKQLSDYAKALGCEMSISSYDYNNGIYWLRSPSNSYTDRIRYVNLDGSIYGVDKVVSTNIGVVPVLSITYNFNCENHQESNWIIYEDATCMKEGIKYKECNVCKKVLITEVIGIKDHDYVNGICSICGHKQSSIDEIIIEDGYIYFGYYPQTLKKEDVEIISSIPNSDGYYRGSDGERYVKIEARTYEYGYVFNNSTTSIVNGETYYFKVEPIKWEIMEESNGTYKLISTVILDSQLFYSSNDKRTIEGKTIYANNYEYSDIRKWLNNDFLNKAFTEKLQTYITTSIVDNSLSSTGDESNEHICNNTYDKIYLLSIKEMTNTSYGYSSSSKEECLARCKQPTDYAKAVGGYMNTLQKNYNNGYYWLRIPSEYGESTVRIVSDEGIIGCDSDVCKDFIGIVPALLITIK